MIVGRSCGEQLLVRTDFGGRISVRVQRRLWHRLDLGHRAEGEVVDGRPTAIRPLV